MSSPARSGPSVPKSGEREKRLSRMLTRVRSAFNKKNDRDDGKGASVAPAAPGPSPTAPAPDEATRTRPAQTTTAAEGVDLAPMKVSRLQLYEERAKKLGERYGLQIKPSDWYLGDGHALRVEKPIRMRVHRDCHNCGHTFGAAKECPSCSHVRCKQCQRHPPKRTETEREESRKRRAAILKERADNQLIVPDWGRSEKQELVLVRPAKKGGQDLVYRKPRQRVRRMCCECAKLFVGGNKVCPGCQHVRCTDCPRDPPKKNKYPYGYPGDEFGTKSIPRYDCHQCQATFPADATVDTQCPRCLHKRCAACQRARPRKVEPEPDPEVWKSLQVKLGNLHIE